MLVRIIMFLFVTLPIRAETSNEDLYRVLGVSSRASVHEIRRAFRSKARNYHPDVSGRQNDEAFLRLSSAYEVLSDPVKRRNYDAGDISLLGTIFAVLIRDFVYSVRSARRAFLHFFLRRGRRVRQRRTRDRQR
mmetsp:Transcript_15263/g.22931  ORF Transcript_15263/g.22931 Transcript_15263/m.22931 type:complete len:134 (+) Transcript_15263:21-422(+)